LGKGAGYLNIKGICGIIQSETYSITDAKYYADNTKINSYMSAYEGHQCAFIPYTVQYGDEVSFKFNTKPTHCLIGIGTSSSSCLVMEFNTNQTKIHRSYGTGSTYNNNWLDTYSKIGMHMINLSSSEDRSDIYLDDVYYDYWRCQLRTNNNVLRVEKFNNDDYNIEIIVL